VTVDPIVRAVLAGIVEGATEFIPVSSTGHLDLLDALLGFTDAKAKVFEIFIQLGAILAIVVLYWRTIVAAVAGVGRHPAATRLVVNLAVAFVPVAIVGLLLHHWITAHLLRPAVIAGALIVGGVIILIIERWEPRTTVPTLEELDAPTALGIGLAQLLSLIPGTSRSGATIMGGYALGLSRRAATEFSFLLAVPVMIAATLFDLFKNRTLLTGADLPAFAVGFVVSFITAIVVVRGFLRYVSRHSFAAFAWYRIALGIVVLLVLRHAAA
jgi:undecaprenyl-diphosphatase